MNDCKKMWIGVFMAKINLQDRVGEVHSTKNYGDLIIDKIINSKNVYVTFLISGYSTKCAYYNILENKVRDKSLPKVLFGWGINDADYQISHIVEGKTKRCPIYTDWKDMLKRCYSEKNQIKNKTYRNITVCEDWKYFSNFKKWVDCQPNKDWQNCELDKDLINPEHKQYSPESCSYVSSSVNKFISHNNKRRGDYLIGVSYYKKGDSYRADCNNPFKTKVSFLGYFKVQLEAHKAWQAKKHEYACMLADLQEDERVAKALRERYAPDKDWTKW